MTENNNVLDTFLLHIPHAFIEIPNYEGFIMDKIEENIHLLTDWATDKIFDIESVDKIVTPYSRLFCDVERCGNGVQNKAQWPLYTSVHSWDWRILS